MWGELILWVFGGLATIAAGVKGAQFLAAQLARLAKLVGQAVVEALDERLALEQIRVNLTPEAGKWPNGSTNLPDSLTAIYARFGDVELRLGNLERQAVDDDPRTGDDIDGHPV